MDKTTLFSVLMANYNNEFYIKEAINSVLDQTYTHWEIVIVDDCSTDDSCDLYQQYSADPRIKIYYNEVNQGCGYTKRRCAELATGEICGFLDPDDALLTNAIELMVETHLKNPKASLVHSQHYNCDKFLNIIDIGNTSGSVPDHTSFLESNRFFITHFATFKKSFYDRTVGINPALKRAVDQDLYYKLEEVGKTEFIEIPVYLYRQGTGNNLCQGENIKKASCWHLIAIYSACERRHIDLENVIGPYLKMFEWAFSMNAQQQLNKCMRELEHATHSKRYKIGKFILNPFSIFLKY